MPKKVREVGPPDGLVRLAWRAPLWLYRLGLGWLLGRRFMRLHHVGRVSGAPREAVVEVLKYQAKPRTYYAAAGYGPTADWYQNVVANPDVKVDVGGKRIRMRASALSPEESGQMMVAYAHEQPTSAKGLMWLIGYKVDGTDEDYFRVGHDLVPFVAFRPRRDIERASASEAKEASDDQAD
jgi:deazaflavin-dependent oxidoreductase (nitroreductase family)